MSPSAPPSHDISRDISHDISHGVASRVNRTGQTRRRRRLRIGLLGLLSLGLTASGLAAVPTPSAAAAGCSGDPVVRTWREPEQVALGTSKTKSVDLIVATRVECAVRTVKVTVSSRLLDDTFALTKYSTTSAGLSYWGVRYDISPKDVRDLEAGRWQVRYTVTGAFGSRRHDSGSIQVRRAIRLHLNARPEPVRKGRTLTITGTVSRADWDKRAYRRYGSQRVQLQWRSTTGSYHRVKTITGRGDGSLRTSVKATRDGCYRFVYAGRGTAAPATSGADCVDVRG